MAKLKLKDHQLESFEKIKEKVTKIVEDKFAKLHEKASDKVQKMEDLTNTIVLDSNHKWGPKFL